MESTTLSFDPRQMSSFLSKIGSYRTHLDRVLKSSTCTNTKLKWISVEDSDSFRSSISRMTKIYFKNGSLK